MPWVVIAQQLREIAIAMKKPTNKLSVRSAFSLVELLVVIAVIAVIAAIAIPNIAGITQNAQSSTDRRNAQNLASISSAAIAAGAPKGAFGASASTAVEALTNQPGLMVTNGTITNGPFRVDGLSTSATNYMSYLSFDAGTGALIYKPQ